MWYWGMWFSGEHSSVRLMGGCDLRDLLYPSQFYVSMSLPWWGWKAIGSLTARTVIRSFHCHQCQLNVQKPPRTKQGCLVPPQQHNKGLQNAGPYWNNIKEDAVGVHVPSGAVIIMKGKVKPSFSFMFTEMCLWCRCHRWARGSVSLLNHMFLLSSGTPLCILPGLQLPTITGSISWS